MKPDYVISALDAIRASQMAREAHHITDLTAVGAACIRCHRLLTATQWAAPCPGLDPVLTQPVSVGPTEP